MNNDKDKSIRTLENLIQQGFLAGKGHQAFIHSKVQKLVAACYLITDLMKDNEPLKWQIRDTGLNLLSDNLALLRASSSDRKTIFDSVSCLSLELISLIEIAHIGALVSSMNFNLLQKEFSDLITLIQEKENPKALESSFVLSKQFLEVDKGQLDVLDNMSYKTSFTNHNTAKIMHPTPPINRSTQKDNSTIKNTNRRDAVIAYLRKINGEASVKDFVLVIPDCSEKTIQRELLSLVAEGVLKKTGERRWSKYSLR